MGLAVGGIAGEGNGRGDAQDWKTLPINNISTRQETTESFVEQAVRMIVRSVLHSFKVTDYFRFERDLELTNTKPLAHCVLRPGSRGKS